MSRYGLLGGSFEPNISNTIVAEVGYSANHGSTFRSDLLPPGPGAYIGLDHEFAVAAMKGLHMELDNKTDAAPSGTLQILWGVVEEANSSPILFCRLARIIVRILFLPNQQPDIEELKNVIETVPWEW
jgi:hypothetical protein